MKERNYCVYKHTSPNGKVYIGITCRKPENRWGKEGNRYTKNLHFYNAIQKYGWDNISHEILFEGLSKQEACEKEIELIAFYKSNQKEFGYNKSTGGEHGCKGAHWSLSRETKRKISEARKGCVGTWKGKKLSEETKRKIGEAHKGEKNHLYGKHHSVETKQKIAESNKGQKRSEETKRKMSESQKGRIISEEHKRKISESRKGHKYTAERSAAYKEYKANGGLLKWNEFQKDYTNLMGTLTN